LEQRDRDPGDLAGDLGRWLRGAGKERERKVLTGGVGLSAGEAGRARDERVARRSGPRRAAD